MPNVLATLAFRRLAPIAVICAVALAAAAPSHGQGPPPLGAALVPAGAVVLPSGATEVTAHHPLDPGTCAQVAATLPPAARASALASLCDTTFTLRHRQMTIAEVKALIAKNGSPPASPVGSAVTSPGKSDHPRATRAAFLHPRKAALSIPPGGGGGFCQAADSYYSGMCYGSAIGDMCGIGGCSNSDARCLHYYEYNRYNVWNQGISCYSAYNLGTINVQWQGTWNNGGLGPYFYESSGWDFYGGFNIFGNCSCTYYWERVNVDTYGDLWGSGTNTTVVHQ
ncbi:MAG: hypothetical protein ACRDFX_06375 [Chloroflexota bacterium]